MDNHIVVAVSPHYTGRGWTDEATGLVFEPSNHLQPVMIAKNRNLSGIKNSLRLNNLLLLEGKLEQLKDVDIENINPAELTKKQFASLMEKMKNTSEEIPATNTVDTQALSFAEKEKEEAIKEKNVLAEELAETKKLFYGIHTFTEDELKNSYFTVDVLKAILDEKEIAYTEKETKAALKKKLTAV